MTGPAIAGDPSPPEPPGCWEPPPPPTCSVLLPVPPGGGKWSQAARERPNAVTAAALFEISRRMYVNAPEVESGSSAVLPAVA